VNKATPDTFVFLVAAPWGADGLQVLREVFVENWSENLVVQALADSEDGFEARVELDGIDAGITFDDPIPELVDLTGTTIEPYAATEVALLEAHESLWRFVVSAGTKRAGAVFGMKLMAAMCVAGASGVFLPMTMRLHSPRTLTRLSINPNSEQNLANIYVHCWDQDGWMRTRGLTAFGLPELETPISDGPNAAYFRLMDLSANMIAQEGPFPSGGQILAGPQLYSIADGPQGPADERIPLAGFYGVQTVRSELPTRRS